MNLTPDQFQKLIQPLIGLPVSLPWKGYGSAVFFELGQLSPRDSPRAHHDEGEACLSVEWDWRVEAEGAVLYGSSNSRPEIKSGIQTIQGKTIESLIVDGSVPELVVHFSNGHCLRSMGMTTGDPEWMIKIPQEQWIYARGGKLVLGDGRSAVSPAENEREEKVYALAQEASLRWGVPEADPVAGRCVDCASFIPLDGEGHLLDFGCCMAAASPFDGRAVMKNSGCPAFTNVADANS